MPHDQRERVVPTAGTACLPLALSGGLPPPPMLYCGGSKSVAVGRWRANQQQQATATAPATADARRNSSRKNGRWAAAEDGHDDLRSIGVVLHGADGHEDEPLLCLPPPIVMGEGGRRLQPWEVPSAMWEELGSTSDLRRTRRDPSRSEEPRKRQRSATGRRRREREDERWGWERYREGGSGTSGGARED